MAFDFSKFKKKGKEDKKGKKKKGINTDPSDKVRKKKGIE